MLPRVFVTGNTGQVGSAVVQRLQAHAELYAPDRSALDLNDTSAVRRQVTEFAPHAIVHAAAYTAVDKAESERAQCFAVNADATRTLAEAAARTGALLLTFSSDYVFDGTLDAAVAGGYTEDHPTCPINVYGESKVAAEQALAASGCRFLNFRTSWVYSARGHNFVKTMLRLGAERASLNIVDDQRGSPTCADDLADAVAQLLTAPELPPDGALGTYHLCGTGTASWYDFAAFLFATARNLQPQTTWAAVQPVGSDQFPTPARRPRNSMLDCTAAAERLQLRLPDWRQSASDVVRTLLART